MVFCMAFLGAKICHFSEVYFYDFPILGMVRGLGLEVGKAIAVTAHEGIEPEGVEVAGNEALWFGERAKEPAEVELVGPDGDVDLIAA